jgi:hypothetical protein
MHVAKHPAIADLDGLRTYLARTAPFRGGEREARRVGLDLDLPKGAITVLAGVAGAGRTSLAARIAAEETKAGRPVAWIDGKGTLYPPALAAAGVALHRVLMVQSTDERAVYAAEQITASGAFGVVIASGIDAFLTPHRSRRLQTSAEGQRASLVLVLDAKTSFTQAALELRVSRSDSRAERAASRDPMMDTSIVGEVKKDRFAGSAKRGHVIISAC